MKLEPPVNENYAAVVVTIRNLNTLTGLDNIVGASILGSQAIVSKDTAVGQRGVFFGAETQLSPEFASKNNLHRHGNLNDDESAKGYLEDNRRVKAIKFHGHRSDALFMPLESLVWTGFDITKLEDGDTFDKLNGHDICNKYVNKIPKASTNLPPKERRVDEKLFPAHFDTANYWRNEHLLDIYDIITVTQKLHGTSVRIGNTLVKRKLNRRERLAKFFGAKVTEFEYANVYGSRKVIKDINDPNQDHWYGTDLWTEEGSKLDGILPKGFIVYGELIGWVGEKEIQPKYTYNIPKGTCQLYVYRVTQVNPDGIATDLSWDQLTEFCTNNGLKHVPVLWSGKVEDFNVDNYLDIRYRDSGATQAVPLSPGKLVDEGVCIRREGLKPLVLKAKSPMFLQHETKLLDKEVEDIEQNES